MKRTLIKSFGVMLASLVVAGQLPACAPQSSSEDKPTPQPPEWDQLRQCWLNLGELNVAVQTGNWGQDIQARLDEQSAPHRAALEALVAKGEIDQVVADQIQLAFEEALFHVGRSMATCYIALPFEYRVRVDLLQQAELLQKLAGDLDPVVVQQAQAAISRDMAFFEAVSAGELDRGAIEQQFDTGNIQVAPEALEAAQLLAALLLESPE